MRYFPRRYSRPGSSPGTLTEHEAVAGWPERLRVIQYDSGEIDDRALEGDEPFPQPCEGCVTWIHLQGTPTTALVERLGRQYKLHPLALEDVINAGQRAKLDIYDDYYFAVANYLRRDDNDHVTADQFSIFLSRGIVISLHEGPDDICDPIRTRLQNKTGLRTKGADYLAYALLDRIVDAGFPLLEDMADRLEAVEEGVLGKPTNDMLDRIHVTRRELAFMRRVLWPQREVVNSLIRDSDGMIADTTKLYFRDVYDHVVQMLEILEGYRESVSSLLDVYLSNLNNRMNEVMKVLTMIATLFLPLSFIAGLYGMNFSPEASHWNMPELGWRYGYFYALGVMLVIAIGMLIVFKRKRWF